NKAFDEIDGEVIDVEFNINFGEKERILKALEESGDNRTVAAEKLGISRRTLQRRLKEYGIN
ncbi:MAG: helix-turn-helix domain-containing protein, partial [Lentisphaeria bacterium]|nr:helix-turn-helix domain-containing protein [Lentisphaeria bacterium]